MGYLKCLKANGGNNGHCRLESKGYLQCRMDQYVSPTSRGPALTLPQWVDGERRYGQSGIRRRRTASRWSSAGRADYQWYRNKHERPCK